MPHKITVTIELEEKLVLGQEPTIDPIWDNAINSGCAIDAVFHNGIILDRKSIAVQPTSPIDPFASEVVSLEPLPRSVVLQMRLQFQEVTLGLSGEAVRHYAGTR